MMNLMVVFLLSFSIAVAQNPCRYEHAEKGVIDITTIGHSDGTPAFADRFVANVSNTTGYKYSYNPCKPFTQTSACDHVAVCQIQINIEGWYALAYQKDVSWHIKNNSGHDLSIRYHYDARLVIVELVCSTNGSENFEVLGEHPSLTYTFRLTHKCACWNACTNATPATTTIKPTTPTPVSSACRFDHPEKGVIDFSFIGRTDERAAYSDESTRTVSNFKYSYNPCRSFSQGSDCIGVSVCQISKDGQQTTTLGTQESAWWDAGSTVNSVPSVNYVYGDKKVSVLLQCSNEGNNEFQAYGEDPVNTFKFQLTHKCACWNGCSN